MMNNIAYADDMSLLSPSPEGLQKLIDICEEYEKNYNIIFNPKKSIHMCFTGKNLKIDHTQTLTINSNILQFAHKAKYLDVFVTSDCSDNSDRARQLSRMYCRSNMLIQNFMVCSTGLKIKLLLSFCCNLNCAQ